MDAGLWEGKGRQERRIEGEDGGMDREVEVGGKGRTKGTTGEPDKGRKEWGLGARTC